MCKKGLFSCFLVWIKKCISCSRLFLILNIIVHFERLKFLKITEFIIYQFVREGKKHSWNVILLKSSLHFCMRNIYTTLINNTRLVLKKVVPSLYRSGLTKTCLNLIESGVNLCGISFSSPISFQPCMGWWILLRLWVDWMGQVFV